MHYDSGSWTVINTYSKVKNNLASENILGAILYFFYRIFTEAMDIFSQYVLNFTLWYVNIS